jgi:hypothetical protein
MGFPVTTLEQLTCCYNKTKKRLADLVSTVTAAAASQSFSNRTLVGGAVVVADASITANSILIISRKTAGGTPGTGHTYVLNPGVGVTITSTSGTDTSVISVLTKY